jgi:hypothetical protein
MTPRPGVVLAQLRLESGKWDSCPSTVASSCMVFQACRGSVKINEDIDRKCFTK